jgi:hypothetical protein
VTSKVSVHGGHSGEFCGHAADTLEQIVERYIELGFEWICLTEHMPLDREDLIPQEDFRTRLDSVLSNLIEPHNPDLLWDSVHHVHDLMIDGKCQKSEIERCAI